MFPNSGRSKKATVRPFIKHSSEAVPVPPSSLNDIFSSRSFQDDDDDDDTDITASQLIRESNFKLPAAPRGILKRSQYPVTKDPLEDSFFGSQQGFFDDYSQYDNKPTTRAFYNEEDDKEFFSSQHSMASQQLFSQTEDVIPSSQPPSSRGQRFIPSFTPKRVRIADNVSSQRTDTSVVKLDESCRSDPATIVEDSPFYSLDIPGFSTPGGTMRGGSKLRSVNEVPKQYRCVFPFPYFNIVQSRLLDDVLYTDKHMVVCAPTGSGKTAVFELAIVHLLMAMGDNAVKTKIVYMAPIKALCSQRCEDWKGKFEPLGLKCQELTGDTEVDDYFQLQEVNIVMTTPEKWDSMTRKWRDNKSLVQLVKLFLIDEVHSLNEEDRGATVEAVISRMKTVQAAVVRETTTNESKEEEEVQGLRFLAVSATIPNIEDVAAWLETGGKHAVYHKLDESHRPVKLRKVVLSYPCSKRQSEFRFDLSLNYKLSGVIQTYSDQKPTLVFCATRKSVQQAASILVKEARFIMSAHHRQRLQKVTSMIREAKLRELLLNGVGYHHAGLDAQDRKYVEEMFISGDLPVLIATSTLAMGVNLPAHLVVIKSTQHYVSGMYCEYTETQILQMIGRAGRPQYDTSATAVIMTKHECKTKYESLLNGCDDIESSLHNHLIEHLNAEIVLHTINDISVALEWLRSTFLYIRIMKNPSHYGVPTRLSKEQIETKLQDMCIRDLNLLSKFGLVKMDPETMDLKPMETGRLMARYCIAFDTMKKFSEISGTESMEEVITMLCKCKEFADIQLRVNERKVLNMLNKDKNRVTIRFPMKGKIKTTDMKVNCLVQAVLGCLPIQDFGLTQDCTRIFRAGQRLTRCLQEFLMQRNDFKVLLHAAIISKCFRARLWENSKHIARQIDKIGPALGTALVNANIVNFQKLESTNPRELELILNRHPPFGNQILDSVTHLPKYDVSIEQVARYSAQSAEITITISLMNKEKLMEKQTAKFNHGCMLLIGDADNKIVYKQRVTDVQLLRGGAWCKKIEIKRASKGEELSMNLISQDYVGLDVQSIYTPFYSGPKHLRAVTAETSRPTPNPQQQQPKSTKQGLKRKQPALMSSSCLSQWLDSDNDHKTDEELPEFGDRKPCGHRCSDKDSCAHECCKCGVAIQHPLTTPRREKGLRSTAAASTPSVGNQPPRLSGLQQYFSELHAKADGLPQTPTVKRMKVAQGSNRCSLDLDRFAFTPQTKAVVPSAASSSTSSTLSLTPSAPKTPATPSSAKGWEMLDMYQQTRYQEISTDEQEETEDTEAHSDQDPQETVLSWTNMDPWTNINDADMSWSDSDLEEMVLDRYVQGDNSRNTFCSYLFDSPPDQHLQQQQYQLSVIDKPTTANQYQQHKDQQQLLASVYEPAPAVDSQQQQQHNQKQGLSQPNNTPAPRRRGQVFAWKSPTSQPQCGEAPVVIPSPPTRLNPPWLSHKALARQPLSHAKDSTASDFVSAKTAMASQSSSDSALMSRPMNNVTSSTRNEGLECVCPSPDPPLSQYQSPKEHDQPTTSDADTSVIILSDDVSDQDVTLDSSDPFVMNSSSDEEFLNSCLEVESREAIKTQEAHTAGSKAEDKSGSRLQGHPPSGSRLLDPMALFNLSDKSPLLSLSPISNQSKSAKSSQSVPSVATNGSISSPPAHPSTLTSSGSVQASQRAQNDVQQIKSMLTNDDRRSQSSQKALPSRFPASIHQLTSKSNKLMTADQSQEPSVASSVYQQKESANNQLESSAVSSVQPPFSPEVPLTASTRPAQPDVSPLPSSAAPAPKNQTPASGSRIVLATRHKEFPCLNPRPARGVDLHSLSSLSGDSDRVSGNSLIQRPSSHRSSIPSTFNSPKSLHHSLMPSLSEPLHSPTSTSAGTNTPSDKPLSQRSLSHKPPPTFASCQDSSHHTPRPSLGVSLRSPPSSSDSNRSMLWSKKVGSPLLRRQKSRSFFTISPDKSPEAADDAQAMFDRIFQGIF